MPGSFKQLILVGVAFGLSLGVRGGPEEVPHDLSWYTGAVQDVIMFDGTRQVEDLLAAEEESASDDDDGGAAEDSGRFYFNDKPTTLEQLAEQLKESDSVCLLGSDSGTKDGLARQLAEVLVLIGETKIEDEFINLNMEYMHRQQPADYDIIKIAPDGTLSFGGKPVELADLPGVLPNDRKVGIESDPLQSPPPFSRILAVVEMVGRSKVHHLFIADRNRQVQVSAKVFQINEDGSETVISSPKLTTQPGYQAMIRSVQNNSGYESFPDTIDPFHQEDLANLGVRFSVCPALIGDHIRLSGVIVLVKQTDRHREVFKQGGVPIYSYAASKIVCPFSCVMPPDKEYIEIPVASADGLKTVCRLSATLVDNRGVSRSSRDEMRKPVAKPEKNGSAGSVQ